MLLDKTFILSLLPKPHFFTLKHASRGGQQSDSPVPVLPWRWGCHLSLHLPYPILSLSILSYPILIYPILILLLSEIKEGGREEEMLFLN